MATGQQSDSQILTVNAGSSSLKFALFRCAGPLSRVFAGKFERIGLPEGSVTVRDVAANEEETRSFCAANHVACVPTLQDLLKTRTSLPALRAIGHLVSGRDSLSIAHRQHALSANRYYFAHRRDCATRA